MSARPVTVVWHDGSTVLARSVEAGLPVFGWGRAPAGVGTRRQLRAAGLRRRRGQTAVALLTWHKRGCGRQVAELFRLDEAIPRRPLTPAMQAAVEVALAARRFCHVHRGPVDHYVRTPLRQCAACFETTPAAPELANAA